MYELYWYWKTHNWGKEHCFKIRFTDECISFLFFAVIIIWKRKTEKKLSSYLISSMVTSSQIMLSPECLTSHCLDRAWRFIIYYYLAVLHIFCKLLLTVYKMPVILNIVNKKHACKRQQRTMETWGAQCQSQQVIRNQPSAETVYEKQGAIVNTDLQHSHSILALAYINYLAN